MQRPGDVATGGGQAELVSAGTQPAVPIAG
jgi:hypothetical protein